MLLNYLKIALRNFWRQKFYSIINVFGLAVGIACFLFILLFVKDELSYDRYHSKADQIYRLNFAGEINGTRMDEALASSPMGPTMVSDFPEVLQYTRLYSFIDQMVSFDQVSFQNEDFIYADSTLFDVFDIDLVLGNPKKVLAGPNKAVISQSLAEEYFPDENPVGQMIYRRDEVNYEITGVFKDILSNTHFRRDIFASFHTLEVSRNNVWLGMFNYFTYLVLQPGTPPEQLEAKFPDMMEKYMGPESEKFFGKNLAELAEEGTKIGFYLTPMTSIHLYSNPDQHYHLGQNGDIKYVYIFSIIGVFILVIACINFMNLATARSASRGKEVGMRKVLGAVRTNLIRQFLTESVLTSLLALTLGLILVSLSIPYFNTLAGKELEMVSLIELPIIVGMIGVIIFVGFLAGSYPAFYLSGFRPIDILKGTFLAGRRGSTFRNGLVVFQFASAIILILGTLVIFKQLNYVQNKKLGYTKDRVLILEQADLLKEMVKPFKEALLRFPEVENVTVTGFLPVQSWRNNNTFFPGREPNSEQIQILQNWNVDHDYIQTMKMNIILGRDFDRSNKVDTSSIILNQAAAELFGWADPLGKELCTSVRPEFFRVYKVIGVVEDFHYESMREGIGPVAIFLGNSAGYAAVRFNGENLQKVIELAEKTWTEMAPGQPFSYTFMDDRFLQSYETEKKIGQIAATFSMLAVFVACLGLLGLAAFTAERRTKEIGIRKVMGASVTDVVLLLTSKFSRLILIAFVVAVPIGWYGMTEWLSDFEYRTSVDVGTFILSGLLALVIAWLAMSYQSIRAASSNPIDALRYE